MSIVSLGNRKAEDITRSFFPLVQETGEKARIPSQLSEAVMMATMLLPGTVILYYGDEIGMSDPAQPISCLETEDPYALPPYSGEVVCLGSPPRSRDPARTPMQVGDTMSWNVVVVVAVVVVAAAAAARSSS